MATCIEQRGICSWRVTIGVGYDEGKQLRIRRSYRFPEDWSIAKQRKEAEKKAALLYAEYCDKKVLPGRDMLFSDYADLWLREYAKANLESKNYYCAESRLNLRILPFFGKFRLSEIRTFTITEFVNQLSRTVNPKTGHRLAARTIINYITQLSSMFSIASNWDLVTSNPCAKVIKPKIEAYDINIPSESDSIYMLEQLQKEPIQYQCLVHLGIMTGLRLGEIVGLKWSDIQFDNRVINITRAMSYVPKIGNIDKVPKTRTSRRRIALSTNMLSLLQQLKLDRQTRKGISDECWDNSSYVFIGANGPLGHNSPSRWFRHFIEKVREEQRCEQVKAQVPRQKRKIIPVIRFHDLRYPNLNKIQTIWKKA